VRRIHSNSSPTDVERWINDAYVRDGHDKGWTYIYGRLASRFQPEIVTIGLNPGGGRTDIYDWKSDSHLAQDVPFSDVTNAYFDQPWGSDGVSFTPLQQQIQLLRARYFPSTPLDKILSFQFIPFRSPTWSELPSGSYKKAIELGRELLDWTLAEIDRPKLVIGFGLSAVANHVIRWFDAHEVCDAIPTGWGSTSARIFDTPKAERFVLLPHLSRYQVIGRSQFTREVEVFDNRTP